MGLLKVSKELYGTEILNLAFSFLRKEHSAKISKPVYFILYYEYIISGDGIPDGRIEFDLIIHEVIPKVIAITVNL